MTSRRAFIFGAAAVLAAPAIVKAENLMKVAVLRQRMLVLGAYIDTAFGPFDKDYEEGVWTERLTLVGDGMPSYSAVAGTYIRIGCRVFVRGAVNARPGVKLAVTKKSGLNVGLALSGPA